MQYRNANPSLSPLESFPLPARFPWPGMAAVLLLSGLLPGGVRAAEKPTILWLVAEDMGPALLPP